MAGSFAVTYGTSSFAAGVPAIGSYINTNIQEIVTELNAFGTTGELAAGAVNDTDQIDDSIITTAKLTAATLVTESDSIASNDNDTSLPSSAAVIDYVETGSTVAHDTEGGYNNCDINGTKTKIYTKYFTGTLDGTTGDVVAHGVADYDKIVSVTCALGLVGAAYYVNEYRITASGNYFTVTFDATNIIISYAGTYAAATTKYRIRVDYYL